jgi:hypothetical protein
MQCPKVCVCGKHANRLRTTVEHDGWPLAFKGYISVNDVEASTVCGDGSG